MQSQQAFASLSRVPRGVLVSREISRDVALQRSGCPRERFVLEAGVFDARCP